MNCSFCNSRMSADKHGSQIYCSNRCKKLAFNMKKGSDNFNIAKRVFPDLLPRKWMRGKTAKQIVAQQRFINHYSKQENLFQEESTKQKAII